MMDKQDNLINDDEAKDERGDVTPSATGVIEDETYSISDHESTSAIDTNTIRDDDQGDSDDNMSQDSLIDDKQIQEASSSSTMTTTVNSRMNTQSKSANIGSRSVNLDEHIKFVKQKKDEADVLRLQRFQEQLRKKEQKWQQQQLDKVTKWLQLRNRDTDHRAQVEERRRKREEEAKTKIDEILRREKEREQRTNSQITGQPRGNAEHRVDSLIRLSTDILNTRRAISAPRIRANQQRMINRRKSNDSPITVSSEENPDNSATTISSHRLRPNDGHQNHRQSRHSHDATMTNDDSSLSGTPRSRTRPMPASYVYWVDTGDNNHSNANFMRSTYAATCRSRLSRSAERCPRACRAREESSNPTVTTATASTTTVVTNGETQRRVQSVNRHHLNETICRLAKPKNVVMTQSVHASASASSNGIPLSQSSYQLRVPTPVVTTNNHLTPTRTSSTTRKHVHSRPTTVPSHHISSNSSSRSSPSEDVTSEHQPIIRSTRRPSHRTETNPKRPLPHPSKPPTTSSSRSKPPVQRSLMTTSHSSSSLSTALPTATTTATNKQNIRRIGGASPSKPKIESTLLSSGQVPDNQISTKDKEPEPTDKSSTDENTTETKEEEKSSTNDDLIQTEEDENKPSIEPINIDTVTELINPTAAPLSKREQQLLDEQEYQRKLNQKIREAQQRLELERQREEERQRLLEFEEYEREQEQIRLVEEQRRVEQERLQRAIEECDRENELKRQEEQRLQQQREEIERKQAEETERLNRERQERAKKEEEERNERKKRLDLIMRRTRQVSPSPKPEIDTSKTNIDENNDHDQQQSSIPHSTSENHFPTSLSTDNFQTNQELTTSETPKFKSPLIQSVLNRARNTRSTDNLTQSNLTTSELMTESMIDDGTTNRTDLSDDDQQDSEINNTPNGHSDPLLTQSIS